MDSCELRKQRGQSKYLWLGLLVMIFSGLLAACGNATPTVAGGTTANANPAATATTAPPTSQPVATTASNTQHATGTPGTTPAVSTAPANPTTAPTPDPVSYKPVLRFSSASVAVGGNLTVSGEGYPANTGLVIQLGPQSGKIDTDSRVSTDRNGKFTSKVFFVTYPDGSVVKPGNCTLAVATEDGQVKASASVTVLDEAAAKVSPTKLIQDFFATFQTDSNAALAYLGTDLRSKIQQGQTSLPLLLGVQNIPQSVEISLAEGKANTYNIYENFQAGRQFIQMDVDNDTNGSLKILAIRIPNPPPSPVDTAGVRDSAAQNAEQVKAVLEQYSTTISNGQFDQAYQLLSSRYQQEVGSQASFAANQKDTLKQLKLVSANETPVLNAGQSRLIYSAQFQTQVGSQPSNWADGNNTRWVELIKEGNAWRINLIATSPIS
jgi:hypothetical protein